MSNSENTKTNPKKTPFHSFHVESGAKMVNFGGWELPQQYTKIVEEHHTVRTKSGLFDVSHMGEVFLEGDGALDVARYLVSNDLDVVDGQAQYTCILNEQGGIVDDVIVYRYSESKVMICINAANREKDSLWIENKNPNPDVRVRRASDDYAQIAIQGPNAEQILQNHTSQDLSQIKYYHFAEGKVCGIQNCIIARTGYTGEDGFEVFIPLQTELHDKDDAVIDLWKTLLDSGKNLGIAPIGLGARDTLRMEANMNLYGNDMDDNTSPYESGLGWSVKLKKDSFVGKDACYEFKNNQWIKRQVNLTLEKKVPRPGCELWDKSEGGERVGIVTSGTKSPTLGQGIAIAQLNRDLAKVGSEVYVDIRGKRFLATVIKAPFYKRNR